MSDSSFRDYTQYSTGVAAAALGFAVVTFSGIKDVPAQILLVLVILLLSVSVFFGFMSYSAVVTNERESDTREKSSREGRIKLYGGGHLTSFGAALLFLALLLTFDILVGFERRPDNVEIACLEAILRGWPVCP